MHVEFSIGLILLTPETLHTYKAKSNLNFAHIEYVRVMECACLKPRGNLTQTIA